MRLGHDHVRVRVPATSANLGPGFDALGLALSLHDDIEVRALGTPGVVVEVTGEGAGEVPDGADHLVVRALRTALDHVGASQTGLHMTCHNRIPHGRGLGSSAAAVVAGIMAARMLIADPLALDDDVVLDLAARMEGHPDNAAPALLGGATVAWMQDGCAHAVPLAVHPDIVPVVLVPSFRLATHTARAVLPPTVTHADAAAQVGRAALLVEALGRRPDLLLPATEDLLHQRYRAVVMPDSLALVDALRRRGIAAVVSGAGPTVLVLARRLGGGAGPGKRASAVVATDADAAIDATFGGAMGGWTVSQLAIDLVGVQATRVGSVARIP
jgi:homoserine kinase